MGMYVRGQKAFRDRHAQIFQGAYHGSTKREDVVAIRFVRPDVALVDTLQTVTGYRELLPGTAADAKGRLRTRLLQVMVKDGGKVADRSVPQRGRESGGRGAGAD